MLNNKVEPKQSNPEKDDHPIRKNRRRMNKSKKTCHDSAGPGNLYKYNSDRRSMSSLDLDSIMEELYVKIQRKSFTYGKHDHHGESNVQPKPIEKHPAFEEKLSKVT